MAKEANEALPASSGVDGLIAKLRDEGVSAGREEAEKIVADARAKANEIVETFREESSSAVAELIPPVAQRAHRIAEFRSEWSKAEYRPPWTKR